MSRQVIVSGATGFIGQHLIPLLLDRDYSVVALARDEDKARLFNWYGRVEFLALDIHKESPSFMPEADASLIHLAWQGLPNYNSNFHFEENLPRNYEFIKRFINLGVSKVLVTGTCFEYGFQYGPIPPTTKTEPINPYAMAKDCLRKYLTQFQKGSPFIFQWTRLFYMHGKGQHQNSVLAQLDRAIENGDLVFNMSGGEQLRDYLPVEEIAKRLTEIFVERESGVFNVCSGQPISIRRLVEERIREKGSNIALNLGYYPYPDHEPMAFWGIS